MTFEYTLGRAGSNTRAVFVVEASARYEADTILAKRMLATGYSLNDMLYWCIVTVVERGSRP
jgi:hypothetical protein